MKVEAEIRVMCLRAKERQGLPEPAEVRRRRGQIVLHGPEEEPTLDTLSQTSGLQNMRERISAV